ncbi:GGDEF domain-containing protein [Vibrio bivalvicida]|uniref:diguanylate cyclase n=1 Tax=Vibrio bivalvicida TaxID=1276888 RepID=A0A177Y702_9VIBR|nr:GGDEF domain-containing protein [Vibrio bivalvicida]OAJ96265.1 diguanylate cyclase [Vibrio bivalvicida]
MDLDIFNPSRQLRRAVLFWLSTLLAFISACVTGYNLAVDQYSPHHYIETAFGLLSLYIAYHTYQESISKPFIIAYVFSLIGVTGLATYEYPLEFGVFIWACLFPIMFYLILGRRAGVLATSIGFIAQIGIISTRLWNDGIEGNSQLAINFSLAFITIWLTSHVLEVKRRVSEASLGQLASRDALTGVYNRHALTHNFERYRNESIKLPLSLLILDLDFFKAVNDQYGHDVGDTVLIQTAALIDGLSEEHLVYRIGGEEFCIALHNTCVRTAKEKAEQIRNAIEGYEFNDKSAPISLTASIGVYQCDHYANLESVLKEADKELYRAKQNGRNQVMVCNRPSETALNFS